jgi:hypothetical protein
METKDWPQGVVGFKFATALIHGEYDKARNMLSAELKAEYPTAGLKKNYEDMIGYVEAGEEIGALVMNNRELGNDSLDGEGWAYVSIDGDCWSEAVTITVKPFGPEYLITELIWGRP